MFPRHLHNGLLVFRDVFHGGLGLGLEVRGDRPVAETQPPPHAVEIQIEIQDPVVEPRADLFQHAVELGEPIELMPVQHEIFFAVGRRMDDLARDGDAAKIHADELLQKFIVIAGDVDDARLLAAFAEQFLDEDIVIILPVPFGLQLPAIKKIADEVEIFAIHVAQEIQQRIHLRVLGPEVDVGDPDRAILLSLGGELFGVGNHN